MKGHHLRFWLTNASALFCLLASDPTLAQIVPDATLPVNSRVTRQGNTSLLSGGTRAGANLFHSFEQFSIPTGNTAFFNNALDINNIIARVTGGSISNIDGLLRANGSAHLFLLNPNGIIFGPNAQLNIGGSFLASTANHLNFADGTRFSATSSGSMTPLLTISVPIGLQFVGNAGRILVQGNGQGTRQTNEPIDTTVGLHVQPNQTLAMVGGDVALEGGTLKTAGGRIELGSVAGPGTVSLTPIDKGWVLGYQGVPTFGDIQLSKQAEVDASGVGGGDIQVRGRRVTLQDGSQIEASTLGAQPGGTLNVNASEVLELNGTSADRQFPSGLATNVYPGATGTGGNLTLGTGRLILRDGAQVADITFGTGSAGRLAVNASDSVELLGTSADGSYASSLLTSVQQGALGAGGNLSLTTGRLIARDGGEISSGTFGTGSAGTLAVNASDSVELIGISANGKFTSGLFTSVEPESTGAGGNLTLETGRLIVRDGAQISSATFNTGPAGTLSVMASKSVELIGIRPDGKYASGLFTSVQPGATGTGGNLTLETGQLIVRDGAQVNAGTSGYGAGGTLSASASDSVQLTGRAADGNFLSSLSVSSEGSGKAGTLQLKARAIRLDNQAALSATTRSGNGGDINLSSQDLLLLRHGSQISTTAGTAQALGNGGNITINTPNIVAVPSEDSDIRANAFSGSGGNIKIKTSGIFGIQRQDRDTPQSDITASSQLGINGTVQINTLQVNPSGEIVNLRVVPVDVSGLIAQGCPANVDPRASKFVITGRGGLPANPNEPLSSDSVLTNWATLNPKTNHRSGKAHSSNPTSPPPTQIVEATGWVIGSKGEVILTAQAPTVTPDIPWLKPPHCYVQ